MTLPYDYARCPGIQHDCPARKDCERCLRRTSPGDPVRQAWMEPPAIIHVKCEYLIEAARPEVKGE